MAKELPYFKFYIGEWLNGDITIEDYECQGVFINVCAYYWQKDAELTLTVLMKRFRNYETQINQLIESNLIKVIGENISISFLNEQMESKEIQKITNQKNGAKGGRPRKEETENKPNGFLLETETKANLNPNITNIEERKEEENIEEEIKEKKIISTKSIDVRKKEFSATLSPFLNEFGKDILNAFYFYWSEPNKAKNPKMRFELEKTWSLKGRLTTWKKNENKFNKNGKQNTNSLKSNNGTYDAKDFGKL